MSIEVTPEAAEVLKRSLELGNIETSSGGIRLRGSRALGGGFQVQVELADAPEADEKVVEIAGLRLFVEAPVLDAMPQLLVALDPQHDTVSVRPKD
jgi:Fe-S cluster assembly iron-binding protein IscA